MGRGGEGVSDELSDEGDRVGVKRKKYFFKTVVCHLPKKSGNFGWNVNGNIIWVLSVMQKIPEISVGIQMERSVSVSSDRNIRGLHIFRLEYSDRNSTFHFPASRGLA